MSSTHGGRFIARVSYRAGNRVTRAYVKMPYGGVYTLAEVLSRAWSMGIVRWFRIDTIQPGEITPEIRENLARWPDALPQLVEAVNA